MTSQKAPRSKGAVLPRVSDYTKAFAKDWERLSRTGRYDMAVLKQAMLLLIANEGPLGREWLDHALVGNWADHRECHIGGDFLLVYRLEDSGRIYSVTFVRAGTHAELFQ